MQAYFARLWVLLRWGKNAGSQISPCFWQALLQEALTSAFTTWRALRGGHLVVLEQKSWWKSSRKNIGVNWTPVADPAERDSPNLFFNKDVDSLKHPFTGELIGDVRLDLKQTQQRLLNKLLRCFSSYCDRTHCLVDDRFDRSLHICGVVHVYHPHIRLSYGLGIRVLWCHLQ